MRKTRPEIITTTTETAETSRDAVTRVPQPGRRRWALEAENAKVQAQIGLPVSWIH
jgi:hypothetical protein